MITPPPPQRKRRWVRPRPQLTWISHPRIARHLYNHDCNVVGLLADMAKDKGIDPQLRFRVLEKLVTLLYLPCEPAVPVREEEARTSPNVADIIADAWKDASEP